jgi:hypothetical protein
MTAPQIPSFGQYLKQTRGEPDPSYLTRIKELFVAGVKASMVLNKAMTPGGAAELVRDRQIQLDVVANELVAQGANTNDLLFDPDIREYIKIEALSRAMNFNDPVEMAKGAGMLGAGVSALVLPAVTLGVAGVGSALRAATGSKIKDAPLETLEQGLALAEPVKEIAERLGMEGIAEAIDKHPIIAEFVLQGGHDLTALLSMRGVKGAIGKLAVDFDFDAVSREVAQSLAELPSQPSSALIAAVERAAVNQPILRQTVQNQLEALLNQRLTHQQAIEIAARAVPETPPTAGGLQPSALVPEPGLIDLDVIARQEPRAFGITGRQATGLDADVPLAGPVNAAERQTTVIDQLAANLQNETSEALRIADGLISSPPPVQTRFAQDVGERVFQTRLREGKEVPLGAPKPKPKPVAKPVELPEGAPEILGGTESQLALRESRLAARGAREILEAGEKAGEPRIGVSVAKMIDDEVDDVVVHGNALNLYGGIIPDITQASARVLFQAGFIGGGYRLSLSENDYIRWTGVGAMLLGAGSLAGPVLAKAGKVAAKHALLNPIRALKDEDAMFAFARWFAPEYGYAPEFLAIKRQVTRNGARGEALAEDYAREVTQFAKIVGQQARTEARAAGFTASEARRFGKLRQVGVRQELRDLAELEGPGARILTDPADFNLTPELQEQAVSLVERVLNDFYEVGLREVSLGRFADATLNKRAGQYLPRFYMDLERRLFGITEQGPLPVQRRAGGLRTTKVGQRDDGIPYQVRVEELGEIRDLDYAALRGFSRAWHNVAVEEAYTMLRKLPGRVWREHDNLALSIRQMKRARKALELNDAPASDIGAVQKRIKAAQQRLKDMEKTAPLGMRKLSGEASTGTPGSLGSMTGRYVDNETWRFMQGFENVATPKQAALSYNGLLQAWKFAMTALNLPTHMGNIGSNFVLSTIVGGLPWWRVDIYKRAIADYLAGRGVGKGSAQFYKELRSEGIIGRTFINQETRNSLQEFSTLVQTDTRRFLRRMSDAQGFSAGVSKTTDEADRYIKAIGAVYQAEEEIFKVAVHMHHRNQGKSVAEAAKIANEALVDYSARSGFINFVNRAPFGIPFFTFPAKAGPALARAIIKHPERVPYAIAPFIGLDLIARHLVGVPEIQPYSTRKKGAFDIRYSQVPIVTEEGKMVFMNTGRYTPFGPFVTGGLAETVLPEWWPQALTPSNPLMSLAVLYFARDPLTGEPIVHDLQTAPEKIKAVAGQASRVAIPSMLSRNLVRALGEFDKEALDEFFLEMAGVAGARPVLVEQTGERERRAAYATVIEAAEAGRREIKAMLRRAKTPADTARANARALEFSNRLMRLIMEERAKLPPPKPWLPQQ